MISDFFFLKFFDENFSCKQVNLVLNKHCSPKDQIEHHQKSMNFGFVVLLHKKCSKLLALF